MEKLKSLIPSGSATDTETERGPGVMECCVMNSSGSRSFEEGNRGKYPNGETIPEWLHDSAGGVASCDLQQPRSRRLGAAGGRRTFRILRLDFEYCASSPFPLLYLVVVAFYISISFVSPPFNSHDHCYRAVCPSLQAGRHPRIPRPEAIQLRPADVEGDPGCLHYQWLPNAHSKGKQMQ